MNNTRIYKERERHYNRLVARLSKAQNKGCSKSLQARLSARLERCLKQLKQLSIGVAVLAALGWTAPVIAQSNNTVPLSYVERRGIDNPFDTMPERLEQTYFADIDMDGDKDMVAAVIKGRGSIYYEFLYYKNIGSATMPSFELQANSTMLDSIDKHARGLVFVDIDGDGDQDLFASENTRYSGDTISSLYYYKNVSQDPAVPNFQLQPITNNPFQSIVDYYNQSSWLYPPTFYLSFMDVDNDNDQDCFIAHSYLSANDTGKVYYYKNGGNVNIPDFQLQVGGGNPLDLVRTNSILDSGRFFMQPMLLFDGDLSRDSDIDILFITNSINPGLNIIETFYFKNIGTQGAPNYELSITTPIDSIKLKYGPAPHYLMAAVDLDNDGRTEMIYSSGFDNIPRYFVDTVSYLNHLIQRGAKTLNSYPNPSTGRIQLNQVLTGQLRVCNTLGQEVHSRVLNEAKQLDLSALSNGVYILHIRTKEEDYVQQVMINRP